MPSSAFERLTMQLLVSADRVAIGWVENGRSTACRDHTNVNALFGFCDFVWDNIPGAVKMRRMATKKLSMWLRKAAKYGLNVYGQEPKNEGSKGGGKERKARGRRLRDKPHKNPRKPREG